ncbi:DUF6493 family protein [Streptomyces sp. NPDC004838]
MKELLESVRNGRAHEVPGLLEPLTAAERKECLTEMKALRAEVRGWRRWNERTAAQTALLVAGVGCQTGAAAAAAWINSRELRSSGRTPHKLILDVLADRDPAWLGDVAHRLAARDSTAREEYPLIEGLVRRSGCPLPVTEGVVHGWADHVGAPGRGGLLRLGEDPHAALLVPRIFELARLPSNILWYSDIKAPEAWPAAFLRLADAGVVERSVLVDGCVSRLLRGGRPAELRFLTGLVRRLELSTEEERARIPDWLGMAADGPVLVASHAQGVLAGLAEKGLLETSVLVEMSGAVVFRPEKKLVLTQLVLLRKVLHRDPDAAPALLPSAADAFGHEDVGVQDRALKLVTRYLPRVEAGLREELAAAASLLGPAHRDAAERAFGTLPEEDPEEYREFLPVVSEPGELAPAPESVAELVEALLAVLNGRGRTEPDVCERVLDGLVRIGAREPEVLAGAMREALADRWWLDESRRRPPVLKITNFATGLEAVAAALLDRIPLTTLEIGWKGRRSGKGPRCPHNGLDAIIDSRLWEVAWRLRTDPLPFLLAVPTRRTGVLDPGVLAERLREYGRLGVAPAPVDFGQALLRVEYGGGGAAAETAASLGTPEGDRLAAWLMGEGPRIRALGKGGADEPPGPTDGGPPRLGADAVHVRLDGARRRPQIEHEFRKPFHWLGDDPQELWHCCYGYWNENWRTALPYERESLATWMTPALMRSAGEGERGATVCLPRLAESEAPEGPAGPALHRALAVGLGARHADDRLAAVDATLILAARKQLDPARLGDDLARLTVQGQVKTNRLADALGKAAVSGAYGTAWSVLEVALPGLLGANGSARGLGEVLAVAAECAERCGSAILPDRALLVPDGPGEPSARGSVGGPEPGGAASGDGFSAGALSAPDGGPAREAGGVPVDGGSAGAAPARHTVAEAEPPARTAPAVCPVRAEDWIPGLAELAGKGGGSQVVAQASRLLNALRKAAETGADTRR